MSDGQADSNDEIPGERVLRERLEAMLEREFGHLPPEAVADVLYDALSDWNARGDEASDPGLERDVRPPTGGFMETVSRPVRPDEVELAKGRLVLTFQPTKPDEASNLLGQALDVGALLVTLEEDAPLNTAVNVKIDVPGDEQPVETVGRVVHRTDDGTAVELQKLGERTRERMKSAWRGFAADLSDTSHLDRSRPSAQTSGGDLHAIDRRAVSTITDGRPLTDLDRRIPDEVREDNELPDTSPGELPYPSRDSEEVKEEWEGPGVRWYESDEAPEQIVDLEEVSLADLLLTLSESSLDGVLTVEADERQVQLHFDDGFVVEYAERPRTTVNELGSMLKTAEWLESGELDAASEDAHEAGIRIERALLDRGVLSADQLRQLIASRLTYLVREVCEREGDRAVIHTFDGSYPEALQRIPPLRVHVSVESIIFKRRYEEFRGMTDQRQRSLVDAHAEDYPDLVDRSSGRVERALLDPEHRRLLDWAVSGQRLEDVVSGASLPPVETFATLFALESMALLRFDSTPRPEIEAARIRDDLHVKQLSVHKASYFEVLNVHWSSYDSVIESAYNEAVEKFDVERYESHLDDEALEWASGIKDRLDAAYRVLGERESRHQYRKKIMPDYKIDHGVPALLKRADLAEERGQWDEAVDALRRVLELKPGREDLPDRLKRIAQKKAVQAAE